MDRFDRTVVAVCAGLALATGGVVAAGDHVGAPIVAVTPEPDSQPPVTTAIRVTFGQAMQSESVESRFAVEPEVAGRLAWEGNTLVFRPDAPLDTDTTYTASMGAGAESTANRQTQAFAWSFAPRQPGVLYLAPADAAIQSLWRMPTDGNGPAIELFPTEMGVFDYEPSPDGARIALAVLNEAGGSDMWLINADGSGRQTALDCELATCSTPRWSPDSQQIAYERIEAPETDGPGRVWLYALASGETAPLFEDDQMRGVDPTWSPDGSRLAYSDPVEGVIRVLTLETGQAVQIVSAMGNVGAFSPDGETMVYEDLQRIGLQFYTQLFVAKLAGGEEGLGKFVDDAQEDRGAAWSPDGRWLAFGRTRLDRQGGFGNQLMLLEWESGDLQQATDDPQFSNGQFRWDPTSRYILFSRIELEASPVRPELWLYDTQAPDGDLRRLVDNAASGRWLP